MPASEKAQRREHSRQLDVHRWSDYPEVKAWVNQFWNEHLAANLVNKSNAGPKPKKAPKEIFKVLFLDLYVAWLEDPELALGVSRTPKDYAVDDRYNALHISKKIIEVIDVMLELGFIDQLLGSEDSGHRTRIWALPALQEYFRKAAFSEFLIDTAQNRECIVLNSRQILDEDDLAEQEEKSKKSSAKSIQYDDSDDPRIVPARELLRDYNQLLNNTHLDVGSQERPVVVSKHWNRKKRRYQKRRVSLRQHNKFVRRIFYRGDWNLGGRYHGGWWQQIPSELRKHILIDGNQTQEIDFSGFHISLAYGLEGLSPPTDPYALNLTDARLTDKQQRSAVKLLALTAINAKDRKTAFMAFRNEMNREQAGAENKISFTDDLLTVLLEEFLNENPSIAHYLCADKGVELMAIDGNITSRLIAHFTNKNIPILTVHDSYIVEFEYEDELIRVMNNACKKELGIIGFKIKSEKKVTPRSLQHHQQQDPSGINVIEGYKTINQQTVIAEGYKNRRQRYLDFKDKYF
ncbi:hypothetical protein N9X77_04060 [Luminiphilus sp.]|nr:hypothetical protein [Luminiphilus sp.]